MMTTFKMNRRRLIQGFGVLGGASLLGGLATPSAWGQGTQQRGGELRWNLNNDPASFDLLVNTGGVALQVLGPCHSGLVQYDPFDQTRIIGDLAETWKVSDDGKTYTFNLIPGVFFHDGEPMTSEDVKFTFDVMRAPPAGYVSARMKMLAAIESIETPDENTIVFTLNRPSGIFLATIASNWYSVLPQHLLKDGPIVDEIVGTGPYMLETFTRGTSYEFVANPNYHRKDRPLLARLKAYVIPDQGTALSYFRSGQLNVFEAPGQSIADQIAAEMQGEATLQGVPNVNAIGLNFNTTIKPWDDVRVRKAVALSVDRQAAIDVNFRGDAVLGGVTPPWSKWALPETELNAIPGFEPAPRESTLEEAKALLADAGYPEGLKTRLLVRNDDRASTWGIFLKDQLAKIGIDVSLDMLESSVYSEALASRKYELVGNGFAVPIDDPEGTVGNLACESAENYSNFCDPMLDQMIAEMSVTVDADKRRELANAVERKLLGEYLVYPVAFPYRYLATRNDVHDYVLHGQTDNNRRREHIWVAQS